MCPHDPLHIICYKSCHERSSRLLQRVLSSISSLKKIQSECTENTKLRFLNDLLKKVYDIIDKVQHTALAIADVMAGILHSYVCVNCEENLNPFLSSLPFSPLFYSSSPPPLLLLSSSSPPLFFSSSLLPLFFPSSSPPFPLLFFPSLSSSLPFPPILLSSSPPLLLSAFPPLLFPFSPPLSTRWFHCCLWVLLSR